VDISQHNLLDDFRVVGQWWLPTRHEEKIPGTVTVNPEGGVRLELAGVFSSPEFDLVHVLSAPHSIRLDIVLGVDAEGEIYTLHNLDMIGLSSTTTFRVSYLLAGIKFSSPADIRFCSALVEYSYIEKWSCFQFTRPGKSYSADYMSLEIPVNVPALFKISASGVVKELSLCAYASRRFTRSSVDVRPRAHFTIDLDAPIDLRAFFALADDLGQFMTMLVGEPSYIKKLRLYDSGKACADVFFPSTIRTEKKIDFAEMCFPLSEISNIVQILAERWFSSLPLLEPVYDLLFGTLFGRDSFVRTKFLSLTQALESFHRRTQNATYVSPSDYSAVLDTLVAAVPENVPPPLRKKLSDSLKYANEYSLRKRIKEILAGLSQKTIDVLKISDVGAAAELIVSTRNYLTHFDEDSRTSLVDDMVGMHYMNERLTSLLCILILKRLGMDESMAARGILKRRYFP